jgi:hypothetical protein
MVMPMEDLERIYNYRRAVESLGLENVLQFAAPVQTDLLAFFAAMEAHRGARRGSIARRTCGYAPSSGCAAS